MKALLSTYDKTDVTEFARDLAELGYELVSTGATQATISKSGLKVEHVEDLTGFPQMLGGRVKTLHPNIHGGILARRNLNTDMEELASHKIDPIDLIAVNLYPFRQTVKNPNVTLEDALENIDIGGPTMIRAAAKNFPHVIVVVDPKDYQWVTKKLHDQGDLSLEERQSLALKAFQHVALYDTAISTYLRKGNKTLFGDELTVGLDKLLDLRYGENPHQQAALYSVGLIPSGITGAQQLHGKELSFNNLLDADGAWETVSDFSDPTVAIIKHTNPCGLASHEDIEEAYRRAYDGDPVSAFGGIVAFNHPVTMGIAEAMSRIFYEVIIAPEYKPEALEQLQKKKNLRIMLVEKTQNSTDEVINIRQISGGLLIQTKDAPEENPNSWKVVTKKKPTSKEFLDLSFAWKAVKHIKSNAIVLVKGKQLLGMGAGQPNRIISVQLAAQAAGENAKGSVLASDAFFPFPDGIEAAAKAGATAIVQPGGSIRDQEIINTADKLGISMLFTGLRHFRH
jgi:phosphoribosylaminoimidazolecarboxamide formyltransferase/IMP cyclohydrolase